MATLEAKSQTVKETTENWFGEFIHSLEVKKFQYEQNMLTEADKKFMENLATQDMEDSFKEVVIGAQKFYFRKLINSFLRELFISRKAENPKKMAFDHKGQQIMIWIEVPSGNDKLEDQVFLSEAVVNASFEDTGFSISATVVEEEDSLEVPGHYAFIQK